MEAVNYVVMDKMRVLEKNQDQSKNAYKMGEHWFSSAQDITTAANRLSLGKVPFSWLFSTSFGFSSALKERWSKTSQRLARRQHRTCRWMKQW